MNSQCQGRQCNSPQILCGNTCTDTTRDSNNCNFCGNRCATGQTCVNSQCQGRQCNSPLISCGSACVDLTTDQFNCGSCSHTCNFGETCVNRQCKSQQQNCTLPLILCNGACANTQTSSTNCGFCGNRCSTGQTCVNSQCQSSNGCSGGRISCTTGCKDINTDNNNCGRCDRVCSSGQSCINASCVSTVTCPDGQNICSSGCKNLKTDSNNCGRCDKACSSTQSCVNGICQDGGNCIPPKEQCGSSCVNKKTDNANCGTCGTTCNVAGGEACNSGVCKPAQSTCPSDTPTRCPSGCADLTADTDNCGACGKTCTADQLCWQSSCYPACTIDGYLYTDGYNQKDDGGSACQVCNVRLSTTSWSNVKDGSTCGDAGSGFTCQSGTCAPASSTDWTQGNPENPLPDLSTLLELPGSAVGPPIVSSNNPEVFTGDGVLYGTGGHSPKRSQQSPYALNGEFGVYLHHINQTGSMRYITVMVTNPDDSRSVGITANGTGHTQDELGIDVGSSDSYTVSEEWISSTYPIRVNDSVAPKHPLLIWSTDVGAGAEVDARIGVKANGPVYVYVVVTSDPQWDDLSEAVDYSSGNVTDAPGPLDPPSYTAYGRMAGVYANDTFKGQINLKVPAKGYYMGYQLNTATYYPGVDTSQAGKFPGIGVSVYTDSAGESVGMFGRVYDLTFNLAHDGSDSSERTAGVWVAGYSPNPNATRWWDGLALVNNEKLQLLVKPDQPVVEMARVVIPPGGTKTVSLKAMVPGLTSMPEAIFVVSE